MHRAAKIAASLVGLLLIGSGVGLLTYAAVSAGGATSDAAQVPAYVLLLLPAVLLVLIGAGLFVLGSRTIAAVSGGLLGVLLIVVGPGLLLLGFIFEQSDSTSFDPDRAALVAWYAGAAMIAIGVLLVALAVWWANSAQGRRRLHRVGQVLAFGYGGYLFVQGLGLLVYLPFISRVAARAQAQASTPPNVAVLGAFLAGGALLALFPGAVFVYQGISAYMHIPSGRLCLPPADRLALVFLLAILLGGLLLAAGVATGVAIPPLHALAAISAPLALLALATRRARRPSVPAGAAVTWRQGLLMMAWGMAIAASIAVILEGLSFLYTLLGFLLARHDLNNTNDAQQFAKSLSSSNSDIGKTVQFLFLIITVALLGPLIEEFSKGLGVRFLRSDRPSRYQAFIFGLASGAGFATVEAVEYGAGALSQNPNRWWDTMLLRGGSGSLHALASGIVGLAWYQVFQGQRKRGVGLFLIAVGLHGTWNALNVLTIARIVPYFKDLSDQTLEIGLEVVLGLLAIGLIAAIASLSGMLAREEEPDLLTAGATGGGDRPAEIPIPPA